MQGLAGPVDQVETERHGVGLAVDPSRGERRVVGVDAELGPGEVDRGVARRRQAVPQGVGRRAAGEERDVAEGRRHDGERAGSVLAGRHHPDDRRGLVPCGIDLIERRAEVGELVAADGEHHGGARLLLGRGRPVALPDDQRIGGEDGQRRGERDDRDDPAGRRAACGVEQAHPDTHPPPAQLASAEQRGSRGGQVRQDQADHDGEQTGSGQRDRTVETTRREDDDDPTGTGDDDRVGCAQRPAGATRGDPTQQPLDRLARDPADGDQGDADQDERRGDQRRQERPAELERCVAGEEHGSGDPRSEHGQHRPRGHRDQGDREQLGEQQSAGAATTASAQPGEGCLGPALLGDRQQHQPQDHHGKKAQLRHQQRHGDPGLVDLVLDVSGEVRQT